MSHKHATIPPIADHLSEIEHRLSTLETILQMMRERRENSAAHDVLIESAEAHLSAAIRSHRKTCKAIGEGS